MGEAMARTALKVNVIIDVDTRIFASRRLFKRRYKGVGLLKKNVCWTT